MIYHGTNRQTGAPLSSGATAISSQSAGGAFAHTSSKARALIHAYESRTITYADLCSGLNAIDEEEDMGVPYAYVGGMGMLGSHAAAMARHYGSQQMAMAMFATPPQLGPPHNPTELKSEGVRAGEVIAWRAWKIEGDNLVSIVADGRSWSPTAPMQGDPAAGYGVHAYKNPHGPVLDKYVLKDSSTPWVIGEVALWGDVIEHEEGYRAEFARVHSLVTWSRLVSKERRERISAAYLTAPTFKLDDAA